MSKSKKSSKKSTKKVKKLAPTPEKKIIYNNLRSADNKNTLKKYSKTKDSQHKLLSPKEFFAESEITTD